MPPCQFCEGYSPWVGCERETCLVHRNFCKRKPTIYKICRVFSYEYVKRSVENFNEAEEAAEEAAEERIPLGIKLREWVSFRLRDCEFLKCNPVEGSLKRLDELERKIRSLGARDVKRKMIDEAKKEIREEEAKKYYRKRIRRNAPNQVDDPVVVGNPNGGNVNLGDGVVNVEEDDQVDEVNHNGGDVNLGDGVQNIVEDDQVDEVNHNGGDVNLGDGVQNIVEDDQVDEVNHNGGDVNLGDGVQNIVEDDQVDEVNHNGGDVNLGDGVQNIVEDDQVDEVNHNGGDVNLGDGVQNIVARRATSTGQPTQTVAPQETAASVTPAQSATQSAPAPAAANPSTDVYGQAASNLVAQSTLETTARQILDMGGGSWDQDTVGIPEQEKNPPASSASGQAVNPPVQDSQPAVPSSGPNANPLDPFPQGLPNVGSNVGAGNLDFLSNSPQELGKQNPQLMRLTQEHQADCLRLINEPAEGGGNVHGQLAGAIPQAVTVTPEEREGIERARRATSTGQPTQTVAPQETAASVTPAQSATQSAPAPAAANPSTDVYGQAASNLVAQSTLETTARQILDMGGGSWDQDTVGIPEQEKNPPASSASGQAVNPPVQDSQPAVPSSGPNANPLDPFPQGLPNVGSNVGAGNLDFLSNSPQELGKQNPQLMRLTQEHQADCLRLINEPAEGGGNVHGQLAGAIPQAVTVTPEEREGIERVDDPVDDVNPNGGDVNLGDGVEKVEPAKGSRGHRRKRYKGVKCNPHCICTSRGCPCSEYEGYKIQ